MGPSYLPVENPVKVGILDVGLGHPHQAFLAVYAIRYYKLALLVRIIRAMQPIEWSLIIDGQHRLLSMAVTDYRTVLFLMEDLR